MSLREKWSKAIVGTARKVARSHPLLHAMARDQARYQRISIAVCRSRPDVLYVPILGMHRSGTSCVTNLLAANGLYLGADLIETNKHNPKGFWESAEAISINDALLRCHGAHYLDPPPYLGRFGAKLRRRALRYLVRLGANPVVGWKDPRTTVTWPAWHELLYKNQYRIIACFRNPHGVAASLCTIYKDLTPAAAVEVWLKYNRRLVSIDERVEWVNFDAPLAGQIRRVCGQLGLTFDSQSMAQFDENLVHTHASQAETGNPEADCVYQWLLTCWQEQEKVSPSTEVNQS